LYVFVFADVYLLVTLIHALREMWYDELFTFYMSQLPSMGAVWSALKDGADLNPPLFYLVTRTFQAVFGNSALVTRLPAIFGFLIMTLCVFRMVSRYGSRLAGLAAMTFPLVSGAYYYAHEARAYGMVLGFTGLAAICWQAAARDEHRKVALPGLALALGCALLSHCYAVLVLVAFAMGEAARVIARRRPDWPMLTALGLPCPVVLCYLPMLAASRGDPLDNPVFRPEWSSIGISYQMVLGPALWPLVAALAILAVTQPLNGNSPNREKASTGIPLHEMVLASGLAIAPLLGVVLAMTVTRIFMARYGLPAIIGSSLLLGALVASRASRSPAAAAGVIVIFASTFSLDTAFLFRGATQAQPSQPVNALQLAKLTPGVPIVMANPLLFLEFDHYESKDVTDRMYFLTDRTAALKYTGTAGFDIFYRLRKWFPIRSHLEDYHDFLSAHRHFFVLTQYEFPLDWVMRKMNDDSLPLTFIGQFPLRRGNVILAEAWLPGN
jgi:hypothetical protein